MIIGSNYTTYYYVRNAQCDVVKLIDENGNTVVEYTDDSWGKILSTTGSMRGSLGYDQPFRYRGYVYDKETGWYYLQSRYYDPTTCRFISSDVYLSTGQGVIGHNSYAYCLNNPIIYFDFSGEFAITTAVLIGIGIGVLIGGAIGAQYGYNKANKNNVPKENRWKYIVGYGIGGAVVCGVIGGFMGYGIGFLCGAKATSGLALKAISKGRAGITQRTWGHILTREHAWNLVMRKITQQSVKTLISNALKKGATTLMGSYVNKGITSLVYETVYAYLGQRIIVRYSVIDGIIRVSDAWVKTR